MGRSGVQERAATLPRFGPTTEGRQWPSRNRAPHRAGAGAWRARDGCHTAGPDDSRTPSPTSPGRRGPAQGWIGRAQVGTNALAPSAAAPQFGKLSFVAAPDLDKPFGDDEDRTSLGLKLARDRRLMRRGPLPRCLDRPGAMRGRRPTRPRAPDHLRGRPRDSPLPSRRDEKPLLPSLRHRHAIGLRSCSESWLKGRGSFPGTWEKYPLYGTISLTFSR